ncbi:MAG: hypothetical protein HFJ28_05615 [Clostridia bacterium]|nr:hypothetical protein [Clostridia bacterium]
MEFYENNVGNGANQAASQGVPAEINVWTKMKNFLFKEITVTMTPKQEKVLREVHDFWHQDLKDFLFQEITIVDNITL